MSCVRDSIELAREFLVLGLFRFRGEKFDRLLLNRFFFPDCFLGDKEEDLVVASCSFIFEFQS